LTKIAKHRRVLFVEGKDYPLLQKLARAAGFKELSAGIDLPAVPSDGFGNWIKVKDTAWGIRKILGGPFLTASLLDRDFRSAEEIAAITRELEEEIDLALILNRKEIENYLLVPSAICSAINAGSRPKNRQGQKVICEVREVTTELTKIADGLEGSARAQYLAKRSEYLRKSGDHRDPATILKDTSDWFDKEWRTLEGRSRILPGKEMLARLREWAQHKFGVTLTAASLCGKMSASDLDPTLYEILRRLDVFRVQAPRQNGPIE
jgi:hypothetical protein